MMTLTSSGGLFLTKIASMVIDSLLARRPMTSPPPALIAYVALSTFAAFATSRGFTQKIAPPEAQIACHAATMRRCGQHIGRKGDWTHAVEASLASMVDQKLGRCQMARLGSRRTPDHLLDSLHAGNAAGRAADSIRVSA